jgi:hypothetical protein
MNAKTERYFTLTQVAKRLDLHRTTVLRMEQRGLIPKAKWIQKPIRGRIYTEADIKVIEAKVEEYFATGKPNPAGMILDPAHVSEPE